MMRTLCAVGMHNAVLTNDLKQWTSPSFILRDMKLAGSHHDRVHTVPSSMPTSYIQVQVLEHYMYIYLIEIIIIH